MSIQSKQRRNARTKSGFTIVEALIASSITIFGAMCFALFLRSANESLARVSNKTGNLDMARTAITRITQTVRMSRNIGDVFGQTIALDPDNPSLTGTIGSDIFPGTRNPVYGANQAPTGGWPASPWPAKPYTLSPQTLICRLPIFDQNGYPTLIPAGTGNPVTATNQDNVDTYVYTVVPDPTRAGEWLLQVSMFPGLTTAAAIGGAVVNPVRPAINPPQTICKGIIGPMGANGLPRVFSYLDRTDETRTPQDAGTGSTVANFTGVIMTLELKSADYSKKNKSTIAVKTTVYMRNNALSTI